MTIRGRCVFLEMPHEKVDGWCEGWVPQAAHEALCETCNMRVATCRVGKSGGVGKDQCTECWRMEWEDPADDWQDDR